MAAVASVSAFVAASPYGAILGLAVGLGALLAGMRLLSGGLSSVIGGRLRPALASLGRRPLAGVALGAVLTALTQSSSVVTILLLGLVDAEVLPLPAAACLVMGANIGTTLTAHLVAFGIGSTFGWLLVALALPLLARPSLRGAGRAALGMGLVILGLKALESGLAPLAGQPAFRAALLRVSGHPWLGLLAGTVLTTVVLSSGVTIGLLQQLARQGLLPLAGALPVLYGDNVGTTTDTLLASLAAGRRGRALALFHLFFNVAGALLFLVVTPLIAAVVLHLSPLPSRQLAWAHTLFNVTNTAIWLPGRRWLLGMAERLAGRRAAG